ncbi:universal stress protein [Aeromicrobium chenweiae]|uniref:Universal stress protein UspA n=1 Tax=Aeromicrobium chenweiae TaxID=2079793 RepID=A0A2S0WKM9_9ACTN|nr:universal stress protein [Aeromicrobium chenweiae]AWB91895.1 universal stress protein UspA [Aeromicrobium chenweiae]TGN32743.1 universal stress protein [Aeromicrobium chenweiae]
MTVSKTIPLRGGVLVAHDGSVPADAALRTAVRVAAGLGKPVTVARAWSISTAPRPASAAPGYMPPFEDFEAATLAALEKDIAPIRAESPDVTIDAVVVHGSPAEKIVEASGSADLVVVGSRGRGGFPGLLLGSVSDQVVRYAKCPVLVDKAVGGGDAEAEPESDAEQMERALLSELKLE